jgi:hypothetical protein
LAPTFFGSQILGHWRIRFSFTQSFFIKVVLEIWTLPN